MRHTANFYLLVSCLLVMVQGFKSDTPSEIKNGRATPDRTLSCESCTLKGVRKERIGSEFSQAESRLQRSQRDLSLERDARVHSDKSSDLIKAKVHASRDRRLENRNRNLDDTRLRRDRISRQTERREVYLNSIRRNGESERREERRYATHDTTIRDYRNTEAKLERREQNHRDNDAMSRFDNRNTMQRDKMRQQENDRRVKEDLNGVTERRTLESFHRVESLSRDNGKRIDREQRNIQRRKDGISSRRSTDRMLGRFLDGRYESNNLDRRQTDRIDTRREERLSQDNERMVNRKKRHIQSREDDVTDRRTANKMMERSLYRRQVNDYSRRRQIDRLETTRDGRRHILETNLYGDRRIRNQIMPLNHRNSIRDSSRTYQATHPRFSNAERSDVRNAEQFSSKRRQVDITAREQSGEFGAYQINENFERREISMSREINTRMSRRDNSYKTQDKRSARLSDTRRERSSVRTDPDRRRYNEDRREPGSLQWRETGLRNVNSVVRGVNRRTVSNRRGNSDVEPLSQDMRRHTSRERMVRSNFGIRESAIRETSTNTTCSVHGSYGLSPSNRIMACQTTDKRDNYRRHLFSKNVFKDQRRISNFDARMKQDSTPAQSTRISENRWMRQNERSLSDQLSNDRRIQIPSISLKSRCLNRRQLGIDGRRNNGQRVLTNNRFDINDRLTDGKRRVADPRFAVTGEEKYIKQRQISVVPDPSMKTVGPVAGWSSEYITADGWSVTRAIVVGFVGIMGRSLWQKQI